jgi:hypothetical protein
MIDDDNVVRGSPNSRSLICVNGFGTAGRRGEH